jgi:hypothetical protein
MIHELIHAGFKSASVPSELVAKEDESLQGM